MKYTIFSLLFCISLPNYFMAQSIVAGPMVGYSTMREVAVWVQTDKEAEISMKYKDLTTPNYSFSNKVKTEHEHGFTAHLVAELLEPGKTYTYVILVNGKEVSPSNQQQFKTQQLWQWRTDAPDFTFVAGSCMYVNEEQYDRPGTPYGGEYQIFDKINHDNPEFMVWLGDNTYTREVDWDSKSGIYHRYSHSRALKELQPLLSHVHNYATWDDHDYGPNDSEGSYWNKNHTKQAFQDFWANQNIGVGGSEGVTSTFIWSDCQFFMLDNRWYRTSDKSEDRHIIGEPQLTWLKEALMYSQAKFKFICIGGQFISDAAVFENHANFPEERQELLNFFDEHQIKNVVFLTGDRHHSEVSKLTTKSGVNVYDITASAFTSASGMHLNEPNHNRVEGSMVGVRNYALIKVSGQKKERKLMMEFKDSSGKSLYQYEIGIQD